MIKVNVYNQYLYENEIKKWVIRTMSRN